MSANQINILIAAIWAILSTAAFAGRPLKVFILAGQSNMQGPAQVRTIERLNMTDDSKPMYKDIMGSDGKPVAVKGVYGVYFTQGRNGDVVHKGPLKPGYSNNTTPYTRFGPEYTFAIYMRKHLREPFLIIKTAWGGKDLVQQFRPPSGGKFTKEKDKHGNETGHFYRLMIRHVQDVLKDAGKYHPAYDKTAGYEIAGFVWFQGFNDLLNRAYPAKGRRKTSPKDYSEYSRLMACFIRDVRKDLKSPNMPFVIGAIGIGGVIENAEDNNNRFRNAQLAPASLPEFKGNVVGVKTENCWDMECQRLQQKVAAVAEKKVLADRPTIGGRTKDRAVQSLSQKIISEVLTAQEIKLIKVSRSNQGFHYNGNAYIFGKIGKAFADAMIKLTPRK